MGEIEEENVMPLCWGWRHHVIGRRGQAAIL
jgi:hypothetical protein